MADLESIDCSYGFLSELSKNLLGGGRPGVSAFSFGFLCNLLREEVLVDIIDSLFWLLADLNVFGGFLAEAFLFERFFPLLFILFNGYNLIIF